MDPQSLDPILFDTGAEVAMPALLKLINVLLILAVGHLIGFIGKVVSRRALKSLGLNKWLGEEGASNDVEGAVGRGVYWMVMLMAIMTVLNALGLTVVTEPLLALVTPVWAAMPNLFAAGLLVAVFHFVVKTIIPIVERLVSGLGFNAVPEKLGVPGHMLEGWTVSGALSKATYAYAMLFAVIEAADIIGFAKVSEMAAMFIEFSVQVLFGGVILVVGFFVANFVHGILAKAQPSAAGLARVAVLVLVSAMGLTAMGVAPVIIHLAFGLTLGACALAFGLGGKEAAGRVADFMVSKFLPQD